MATQKLQPLGEGIRVKYSMTITYIGRLLSLAINLLFVFIITRKLSILEFSWWVLLNKYFAYAIIFTSIYSLWTNRAISRGWNVSRSSIRMSMILGLLVSVISIIMMLFFNIAFAMPIEVALSFILVILEEYLIRALLSISMAYKPQHMGLYQVLLALLKTAFAYVLVIILKLGIIGAIVALIVAKFSLIVMFFILNRSLIVVSNADKTVISKWFKYSWYSVSLTSISSLQSFDAIIVGYISNSSLVIAYYGVIFFLIKLINSPVQARSAIYSKTLVRRDLKIVDEGLWLSLIFLVPAISIISALSGPIIAVFGLKYLPVSPLVPIFALAAGIRVIYFISIGAILAWEQSDEDIYRDLHIRKTALFDVLIIESIQIFVYFVLVVFAVLTASDDLLIVFLWGIAFVIRAVLGLLLSFVVSSRKFGFVVIHRNNIKEITKLLVIGIITYIVGMMFPVAITPSFYLMVMNLIFPVAILIMIYGGLLLLIDKKARGLLRYIIKKIFKKKA